MKDSLSIKEFARLSGIETTTLRYWDEIGLFSPDKRDESTGYRYYSPWQIIAVNFVTVLRNIGVPLKQISEIESSRTPESVMDLIDQQEYRLDKEIRSLTEAHSVIRTRREIIKQGQKADTTRIEVVDLPERAIILGPLNAELTEQREAYAPFIGFWDRAAELRINVDYPIGGYHASSEEFFAHPSEPQRFFSLDPSGNAVRAAGGYLTAYVRGYYGEFGDTPEKMKDYARKHRLTLSGPVFVLYLNDEICTQDPSRYLAQISMAVEHKTR
ncbi:MAG: MerR family transcriptional regulator [Actinomycetia bacterium]|nr:MerR family transcriptional regulator [Actinomycetes bacterium]